jgi:hypothetical protein
VIFPLEQLTYSQYRANFSSPVCVHPFASVRYSPENDILHGTVKGEIRGDQPFAGAAFSRVCPSEIEQIVTGLDLREKSLFWG